MPALATSPDSTRHTPLFGVAPRLAGPFPLLGATILFFAFVLAARVLALAFQRRAP